jgi:GH24 family phage-related lysozyme (muramidase)
MKPKLKSSPAARNLIQRFEPFHETAQQGEDGRWLVGFGHRAAAKPGVQVSEDEAKLLLIYDVMQAEEAINGVISSELTGPQRDALVSFVHGVGIRAFKQSDVARYLFEGRAMAAGEAIALYGDGDAARREAESTLFLSPFAPKKTARIDPVDAGQTVELVVRVENPDDPAPASPPPSAREPAAASEVTPPPPPSPRETAFRRDAEDEVARIIASVGAGVGAVGVEALARSDDEDEISTQARAAEPSVSAVAETEAGELVGFDDLPPAQIPEPVTSEPPADLTESIDEAEVEPLEDESIEAEGPDEPIADATVEIDTVLTAPPPSDDIGAPDDTITDSVEEAEPTAELSAETETAPIPQRGNPAAARVIARMTQEMTGTPVRLAEPETGVAHDSPEVSDLPEGTTLGYVLGGEMSAGMEDAEDGSVLDTPVEGALVDAPGPIDENADLDREISDLAAAMKDDDDPVVEASGPVAEPEAPQDVPVPPRRYIAPDVMLTPLVVPAAKTPPPHPAEEPAISAGAVGEVIGDPVTIDETEDIDKRPMIDDTLVGDHDPLESGDFSPQDLAGVDAVYVEERNATNEHHGFSWGFFAAMVLGAAAAAMGGIDVAGDWSRVWGEKELTFSAIVLVAGAVVAGFAGVTLILDLVRAQKNKAKSK